MPESIVVVVTGVSPGIGRAATGKFAGRGCQVFGAVRSIAQAGPLPAGFCVSRHSVSVRR
jgi:NAD(P)-dependent dehydrogenase (short-subunit alcohol dehydrogenase family)